MVSISYGHGNLYDFGSDFLFKGSTVYSATGAGAVGATSCNTLTQADDYWNGTFIKFTSGANIGLIREVTDFTDVGDTLTHDVFPVGCADGDTFLLSAWMIVEDGQTLEAPVTGTVIDQYGDYLALTATASGGNKIGYITNFTNLSLSTTLFPKIRALALLIINVVTIIDVRKNNAILPFMKNLHLN